MAEPHDSPILCVFGLIFDRVFGCWDNHFLDQADQVEKKSLAKRFRGNVLTTD
jgi:hypothetical protein